MLRRRILLTALGLGTAAFAIAVFATWSAARDLFPECSAPAQVAVTMSLRDLPAPLYSALREKVGDIQDRGGPFDVSDVMVTGHFRRFIFAWQREDRWVLATERGGISYSEPVFSYDLPLGGERAILVEEIYSRPETLCKAATEALRL